MMASFPKDRSFTHNPKAAPSSPEAKAPYVDNGEEIFNPDRYSSSDYAALEWQRMWTRTWTLAGLVADIPKIGDYFKYELGRESFIVVRTGEQANAIKAFYNVCHHDFFDQQQGRYVYFEGTYSNTFAKTQTRTPWYDYNQIMYRLDLADPRLQPVSTD